LATANRLAHRRRGMYQSSKTITIDSSWALIPAKEPTIEIEKMFVNLAHFTKQYKWIN
jgi:hypothetical protein